MTSSLPFLEHSGYLERLHSLPDYLQADPRQSVPHSGQFACHFCGVGTSGILPLEPEQQARYHPTLLSGHFVADSTGERYSALIQGRHVQLLISEMLVESGKLLQGTLSTENGEEHMALRAFDLLLAPDGQILAQRFLMNPLRSQAEGYAFSGLQPTPGCAKLQLALEEKRGLYPFHLRPSVLDITGRRVPLYYDEALERFADLVLEHRPPRARTLIYASGRVDYFATFAIQEVFRLLGVRNMTSNCEHGYWSGSLYQTFVAGEPAPSVSIEQALTQPEGLFLLNGWNGLVTHPPIFQALLERPELDAYLVDVMMTESAQALSQRLGPERVLIIRSGGDSHLALAIVHQLLEQHPEAVHQGFIDSFADREGFETFTALARQPQYAPRKVAERLAPEFAYRERIYLGIIDIAQRLAQPQKVPVHIPSMGFSQTKGVAPHCLWSNILALLGKYGMHPGGQLAGGVLQLPGQVNHETHVQSLSPDNFVGRIPVTREGAAEAAQRMGLEPDAYDKVLQVTSRRALDYSEPEARKELYIFFGGQFATNMMNQSRWLRKLTAQQTQFVVIDPNPDEFCLKHAALILPTPPHVATTKLYQNGEWRLTLSLPRRKPPSQTRSDTTLVYDLMGTIARMLRANQGLWMQHPDLAQLIRSGYMQARFEEGLPRSEGEVSRPLLWERIQSYLGGELGNGKPLYCQPRVRLGQEQVSVSWSSLLTAGSLIHGGVGQSRQVLNYEQPGHLPFVDLYGEPVAYRFFVPTANDLEMTRGIILCSGRSALSDDPERLNMAYRSFNSGKRSAPKMLPDENPLYVSNMLAQRYNLSLGDKVWLTNRETRQAMVLPVVPTSRLKGETVYLSIHKNKAESQAKRYVNLVTGHTVRCPYSGQTNHKLTLVELQKIDDFLNR